MKTLVVSGFVISIGLASGVLFDARKGEMVKKHGSVRSSSEAAPSLHKFITNTDHHSRFPLDSLFVDCPFPLFIDL